MKLYIKQKVFSWGDSFTVKDADGADRYTVLFLSQVVFYVDSGSDPFTIGYLIFRPVYLKDKAKKLSLDDYNITVQTVNETTEEEYYSKYITGTTQMGRIRNRYEPVFNYYISFENCQTWNVPMKNYTWCSEYNMTNKGVYLSTKKGDTMIVASEKATGKVVMAYNTQFFEHKN